MKNSHKCPKCNSTEIIRVPGYIGSYGSGNNIFTGMTFFSAVVLVTRYVCSQCGYSEEWIDDRQDIEKLKKKFGKKPG